MAKNIANFTYKDWHPLTDIPGNDRESPVKVNEVEADAVHTKQNCSDGNITPFAGISEDAKSLLYNIAFKLELLAKQRIQMLKISGRKYENAKSELITQGLIIESLVGKRKYLIPKPEVFESIGLICPYRNRKFVEHSFYLEIISSKLKRDGIYQSVTTEYKIGTLGHTADIMTQTHDGVLTAYELTFSASNIIQNCLKYDKTAIAKIVFLCRNTDLLKAVKSTVLNAGLPMELLSKIDFLLLGSVLNKKKGGD